VITNDKELAVESEPPGITATLGTMTDGPGLNARMSVPCGPCSGGME